MGNLEGKIALITVGNSGIGLATAKAFVNEGAYVFITGRRDSELATAVKDIGTNVIGVQGDVSNLGDLDRLFAQIKREKGKLDIVFANADVATYAPFGKITEEQYDSIFNIKGGIWNHGDRSRSASSAVTRHTHTQDPGAELHAERDAGPEGVAVGPPRQARRFGVLSSGLEPGVWRSDGVV